MALLFWTLRNETSTVHAQTIPFVQLKFSAAEKCDLPMCEICEFAKACHRPKQPLTLTKRITHNGSLKIGDLHPGSTVSVDHFDSKLLGHAFNSYGGP